MSEVLKRKQLEFKNQAPKKKKQVWFLEKKKHVEMEFCYQQKPFSRKHVLHSQPQKL